MEGMTTRRRVEGGEGGGTILIQRRAATASAVGDFGAATRATISFHRRSPSALLRGFVVGALLSFIVVFVNSAHGFIHVTDAQFFWVPRSLSILNTFHALFELLKTFSELY